jgi:SAM-dependent methyltransferase
MSTLFNLAARIFQRALEIPIRGLPKPQTCSEPFDEKLGVCTSGVVWLTNPRSKNFRHGIRYEPYPPTKLRWLIQNSGIDPSEFCFIDVGCGMGRPLIVASQHSFAELIGVDYSPKLCDIARENLQKLGVPARIICQDAVEFEFPERDSFVFLYNPFRSVILQQVLRRLPVSKRVVVGYSGPDQAVLTQFPWLKPVITAEHTTLVRNF